MKNNNYTINRVIDSFRANLVRRTRLQREMWMHRHNNETREVIHAVRLKSRYI